MKRLKLLIMRETPLAELTLRKYEKPFDIRGRALVKKICLSLGLLQEGDSRDVIVDVLSVLITERGLQDAALIEKRVKDSRKQAKLAVRGVAPSNIRRQLKRLRDLYLIEKQGNQYRITEGLSLADVFEEKIEKFYLRSILERIKDYLKAAELR